MRVARRGGAGLFGPERAGIALDRFIGKSAGTNRSDVAPRRGATNALRNRALTGPAFIPCASTTPLKTNGSILIFHRILPFFPAHLKSIIYCLGRLILKLAFIGY